MTAAEHAPAAGTAFLSGNDAVARAVWESGARVGAAYPGTPSTEILESLAHYPDLYTEWSVNEKVSLEVAIGASLTGARAFCAMKHVGLNVAADALMSQTLAGVGGGLVIAVADDVGLSSSQNEQDSRHWGRFAHVPILEPADAQEAHDLTRRAFALSERFETPVLVRLTTRVCHVKAPVTMGEREEHTPPGFDAADGRWIMIPANARRRLPWLAERDRALAAWSEEGTFNEHFEGSDRSVGFVASGPAALYVREAFPDAPLLKLGLTWPVAVEQVRALADSVGELLVVEETEPLLETDLRAAGIACHGRDLLPPYGELTTALVRRAADQLAGRPTPAPDRAEAAEVFPRPPTMCVGCPHLGPFTVISRLRKAVMVSGDIGCYTLGAGHPWQAIDAVTCMGASITMAQGMDRGRGEADAGKRVLAVIGDSTFLHMGMQGLVNLVYNQGNVTLLLLDNRAVGMTGGQDHPGTGRDIHGEPAPRVDFETLVKALGVREERVHKINPYELPVINRVVKQEIQVPEPSVIITDEPCVLIEDFHRFTPFTVVDDLCTGCGKCIDVGCPAIDVTRRETVVRPSGREVEATYVTIDEGACTGCTLCVKTCAPDAIVRRDAVPGRETRA